jgi:hypothetical protein
MIEAGQITANGEGRHNFAGRASAAATLVVASDVLPSYIPVSADRQDIRTYIDQSVEARKPVGYSPHPARHTVMNMTLLNCPLSLMW